MHEVHFPVKPLMRAALRHELRFFEVHAEVHEVQRISLQSLVNRLQSPVIGRRSTFFFKIFKDQEEESGTAPTILLELVPVIRRMLTEKRRA